MQMKLSTLVAALSGIVSQVSAQNNATSEIVPLLRRGYLVPQILPVFNASIGPFEITYPNGIVNYGNNLSLATTRYAPTVRFAAESSYPDALYTLAVIDPDAPNPENPTSSQIRHWLVSGISPSNSFTNYSMTGGNVLSSYRSPAPPAGSNPHRYTSVLLRQQGNQNISLYNQSASISMFSLSQFIQQNGLTIVSANYFNASQTTGDAASASGTASGSRGSGTATSGSGSVGTSSASAAEKMAIGSSTFVSVASVLVLAGFGLSL